MRLRNKLIFPVVLMILLVSIASVIPAQAREDTQDLPVIYAVLFYSPTCPHCHKVITEDLPPLIEKYPDQLFILPIDVSTEEGSALYRAAVQNFNIPEERIGVPALIVGDTLMVGSGEIPALFPGIVEEGLAAGGIDWPDFPILLQILEDEGILHPEDSTSSAEAEAEMPNESEENSETVENPPAEEGPAETISTDLEDVTDLTMMERFALDLTGNIVALIVLSGMVVSVVMIGMRYLSDQQKQPASWPAWIIPTLVVIGIGVASYLSYVELTQTDAVCGPVGDCNTVQQSPYARLFGVLPIGILGVTGYAFIAFAWIMERFGTGTVKELASLGLWGLAIFGTLFSIYLTFLEPFVIGATCMWCITSAIIMTILLWATTPAALAVLKTEK